jgi:GT2 family glycosyltransferase
MVSLRLAAIMILFNHVKEDLKCLDATDSLLAPISNFLLATNAEAQLEEAYLYKDKNRGKWVRSGKVIGRTYAVRGGEHAKAAMLKTSKDQS